MKVKIINLPNGYKRIIYGKYFEQFDLDYEQDLDVLKKILNLLYLLLNTIDLYSKNSLPYLRIKSFLFIKEDIILILLIVIKEV
ncbi:hypothetical protein NGFG_01165 [Neisseria gonorrhoeae MS11]|nr:hypothetical protein NGFG_01165 [Neisseria gonorrhoeae MS11]